MQITLTKEQVREAFGELRYMGADYCYKYDKETRKKTEEVEALKLHLGSMKLGNSVDIRLEATELPKVEPYTVVELEVQQKKYVVRALEWLWKVDSYNLKYSISNSPKGVLDIAEALVLMLGYYLRKVPMTGR